MIEIKKIEGPSGIPIYYQAMPDIVKSVSLSWLIFTGAADDEAVGSPGLYHWFEHVPFRGTVKYPGGYADTMGRLSKYGGSNGAWTAHDATCYWAFTPLMQWRESLSLITDLFAQPHITDSGVSSERLVIHNEIAGRMSSAMHSSSSEQLDPVPRTPFGHTVLGTKESLGAMNADTLRHAHKAGYDRSRASLFVIGNVPESELLAQVEALIPIIPDNGLSPRSTPADFGRRPWPKMSVIQRKTEFSSSMVYVLFSFDAGSPAKNSRAGMILSNLFAFGSMSSPLYRIIREERSLAYHTYMRQWYGAGGALIGFAAECKRDNIDAMIDGFRSVFSDPVVRSAERLEVIRIGMKGKLAMRPIDPSEFAGKAIDRMLSAGTIVNDSDIHRELDNLTTDDVDESLRLLDPKKACTVIFEGIT